MGVATAYELARQNYRVHLAATVRGVLSEAAFLEEAYAMRRFQPVPRLRGRVEVAVGTIKVK